MIKQELIFEGSGKMPYTLHGVIWLPESKEVNKILQISHGMTEHMGRYDTLAEVLTEEGTAVAGFDLRGHGKNDGDKTCASFGEGGWKCVLEDIHIFYELLKSRFPEAKHYMLGFSLGSFLLREYMMEYPDDYIDGAIIMGAGNQPAIVLSILISVIRGEIKKAGWDKTTPLVQKLSFETYNNQFKPNRTSSDWLCGDETQLDEYIADELCRKNISAGLFADLLGAMKRTGNKKACANWRKDLPVLVLSGNDDPVGNMGKGVRAFYKQLKDCGMQNVRMELFAGARHDLLHEEQSGTAERVRERIREEICLLK